MNRRNHISHTALSLIFLAMTAMTACTDELFEDDKYPYAPISFNVIDGDFAEAVSRGTANSEHYENTTALLSDADTLYLSAYTTPGIARDNGRKATRGTVATAASLEDFGVYASSGANENADKTFFFENIRVTRQGSVWMPEEKLFWPSANSLKFHFYAPYCDTKGTEGIVSLPEDERADEPLLRYQVPAKVEDQIDLMWGDPITASASPCDANFHHALTAIRFVTGREMAACTVKSISIKGVKYKGLLNLETGEWELDDATTSYTVECNTELQDKGDGFAPANTPLIGTDTDNQTFLLMPQTLGESAVISMSIQWYGETYTFDAPLNGRTWYKGTTITYRLSANPGVPVLRLEVVDPATGNLLRTIRPGYAGGKKDYVIRSMYDRADGSEPTPIPWTAQLFKDGQPTTVEEFNAQYGNISSFPTSGEGGEEAREVITVLPYPDFSGGMSDHTRKLREATSVGSPDKPKNLAEIKIYDSDPLKGPTNAPENTINTSNCYIVNAPGTYGIPLVYGNAIQNGAEFQNSYESKLGALVNYVGNYISSPYITTDTGEKYGQPILVWSDQLNVISNVRLSENSTEAKKMIVFDVDQRNIRQCNSVVAITDTKGEVMWSWHIWVTDMTTTSEADYIPMPCSDTKNRAHHHYLFHTNVGHIYEGDVVSFITPELTIQYTQDLTGLDIPGNMEINKYTITLQQEPYACQQNEYFLLYQFGRKDPFVPKIGRFYDGNNKEILTTDGSSRFPTFKTIDEKVYTSNGSYFRIKHEECMAYSIKHPEQFMVGLNDYNNDYKAEIYQHMWNITGTTSEFGSGAGGAAIIPYKSVYDPCPVGCKLPIGDWLKQITSTSTVTNNKLTDLSVSWQTNHMGKQYTLFGYTYGGKRQEIFIYASGYRSPYGFWVDDATSPMWYVWLGDVVDVNYGKANAIGGRIKSNGEPSVELYPKNFINAYGVRPMHIEDKTHHFYD